MLASKLSKIKFIMSKFRREYIEYCDELLNI